MNIGDRIKIVRKHFSLTQAAFAEKINLKATAIGLYESGARNVTDRSITDICREFSVSEDWLRNGFGEMFNQLPEEDELSRYIEDLLFGEEDTVKKLIKSVIRTYSKLDDKSKEVIVNSADMFLKELKKEG